MTSSDADYEEPVARCLARLDDRFVGASDWAGEVGDRYRARAREVLRTIAAVGGGNRTGGLPPRSYPLAAYVEARRYLRS